jgi:hypothetical protein
MQNPTLVACIFDNASSAVDAIHELRRTGFSDDQLGIVVRRDTDEHGTNTLAKEIISDLLGAAGLCLLPNSEISIPIQQNEPVTSVKAEQPQEKRDTGIIIGGVIGGILGTIAILQPPEIGMIVVGGILTTILGDATPGGIAANFLHMGVPTHNALYYAQKFQEGLIIFMIKPAEQQQEVQDILHYHRAHSIEVH